MKSKIETLSLLLLAACIIISCGEENENSSKDNSKLLVGNWNSYEMGTEQSGFNQVITTSLTLLYESGISFSSDGTFRPRYHNNGTWTISDDNMGTYELKGTTISLLFLPGTKDEYQLDMQLVKLDEKHLWFKHSQFIEAEHHLERAAN